MLKTCNLYWTQLLCRKGNFCSIELSQLGFLLTENYAPVWRFPSPAVFSFPGDVAGHITTLLERFKLSGVFSFPGDVARQKYSREYPGEYCSSLSDPKLFIITILFCLVTFSCPIFTRIHAYSCKQVTLLVPHQILSYDPRVRRSLYSWTPP
jgi:hypothetical protein